MYDVWGKLLDGIRSMYVDSLACVRVKWIESEWFRIDNGVRQACFMSPWLFSVYMDAVMKEVKMEMGRKGESGDYLASCMQMKWFCLDLRVMVGQFAEVCRRIGLKVNAGKSKVMVLNREEELECHIDGVHLEHVSEFKYLGCVWMN